MSRLVYECVLDQYSGGARAQSVVLVFLSKIHPPFHRKSFPHTLSKLKRIIWNISKEIEASFISHSYVF